MTVWVLRGRAADVDADREASRSLFDAVTRRRQPAVRVWMPHRQVAFGRRDAREPGYERARTAARAHGFEPVERSVGGRAVAYTGRTISFAYAQPIDDPRAGMGERYEAVTDALVEALSTVGIDPRRDEPPDSFCPGTHSLSAGGKIVGIAQRVERSAALTAGIAIPTDRREIAAVLDDVYEELGVAFDPASVAAAGCDPDRLRDAIETALVDGRPREIDRVSPGHSDL